MITALSRKAISQSLKKLILEIKQDNWFWGCRKISGELKNLDITEYPTREFVKQWIIDFSYDFPDEKHLIHDNAAQFTTIDFIDFKIHSTNTSIASPNMNAFTERLIGTIRRKALDHFLLFSEKQIRNIVREFVDYYNNYRHHQGIYDIPNGFIVSRNGVIKKTVTLGGIYHHYFRSSA